MRLESVQAVANPGLVRGGSREHSAASCKSLEHPAWRGLSAGHGGIRAAIGFDAGRDADVAGRRPNAAKRLLSW